MRPLPEKFAQGMLILKRLNIAFGIHNKGGYYIHALAAMHSVMKAASVPVSAHILHDETLDAEAQNRFRKVAACLGSDAVFHDVSSRVTRLPELPMLERFSRGCLFRLFLPDLLPEENVVYLDADIIAAADLAELFGPALEDSGNRHVIMAVKDTAPVHRPRFREYIRHIFGDYSGYFNSVVVVFKNPELNRLITNFADAVLNVLRERPELQFPDQDALNLLPGVPGHVGYLSGKAIFRWNMATG